MKQGLYAWEVLPDADCFDLFGKHETLIGIIFPFCPQHWICSWEGVDEVTQNVAIQAENEHFPFVTRLGPADASNKLWTLCTVQDITIGQELFSNYGKQFWRTNSDSKSSSSNDDVDDWESELAEKFDELGQALKANEQARTKCTCLAKIDSWEKSAPRNKKGGISISPPIRQPASSEFVTIEVSTLIEATEDNNQWTFCDTVRGWDCYRHAGVLPPMKFIGGLEHYPVDMFLCQQPPSAYLVGSVFIHAKKQGVVAALSLVRISKKVQEPQVHVWYPPKNGSRAKYPIVSYKATAINGPVLEVDEKLVNRAQEAWSKYQDIRQREDEEAAARQQKSVSSLDSKHSAPRSKRNPSKAHGFVEFMRAVGEAMRRKGWKGDLAWAQTIHKLYAPAKGATKVPPLKTPYLCNPVVARPSATNTRTKFWIGSSSRRQSLGPPS